MIKHKARWLSIAILAGVCTPAVGASDAEPPGQSRSWITRLWAKPEPPPAKPVVTAPLSPAELAEAVEAEQRAWQRRMDVCTELRRVAMDRKDDALLRQIDELERQAIIIYNQRTTALGVKKMTGPAATAVLDAQAGSRSSVSREVPR